MRTICLLTATLALAAGCSSGSDEAVAEPASPPSAETDAPPARDEPSPSPSGEKARRVVLDCSTQSMADFGDAFADPRNLIVGPLLLVGAAEATPEAVVLAHDGQKFPLLVKAGRTVTVGLPRSVRPTAGLAYGPFPDGRIRVDQAHDKITFVSCDPDEAGSSAGGPVTFWSGFVMTSVPRCLPLDVWMDGVDRARRAVIALGKEPCPEA